MISIELTLMFVLAVFVILWWIEARNHMQMKRSREYWRNKALAQSNQLGEYHREMETRRRFEEGCG